MNTETKFTTYIACSIIEAFCDEQPTHGDIIRAWAYLIKSGDCWTLQGFYGRTATSMINEGIISSDGEILIDIDELDTTPPKTVEKKCAWDFVEKYYPDYYRSQEIGDAGDLQKLVDGEIDDDAQMLLNSDYGGDIDSPKILIDYAKIHESIYSKSIEAYLNQAKTKSFYLFGSDAVRQFEESGADGVTTNEGEVFVFEDGVTDPILLLNAVAGWNAHTEITEADYDKFLIQFHVEG